jgi:hypothetical protein
MVADVLTLPNANRAWRTWATNLSRIAKLNLRIGVEPTFELLFATRDIDVDWQEAQRQRIQGLEQFAGEVAKRKPVTAIAEFKAMELEAEDGVRLLGPDSRWWLYKRIAELCERPSEWLAELVKQNMPANYVAPFLSRIFDQDQALHDELVASLLENPAYEGVAVDRVLTHPRPSEALLQSGMSKLKPPQQNPGFYLAGSDIPVHTVARLLEHPDQDVRTAAALGEWFRQQDHLVRPELRSKWRTVIVDTEKDESLLAEIFQNDSTLAFEWVAARMRTVDPRHLWEHKDGIGFASQAMNVEQRRELLTMFTRENFDDECFDMILRNDIGLYADYLNSQSDDFMKLRPLSRDVGDRWERMAILALNHGFTAEDVANHCTPTHYGGFGPLSAHFLARIPKYEKLANHKDIRLRPAGARGLRWAKLMAERELAEERKRAIHGN